MFERPITFQHPDGSTSPGRVDLYRRGHFVLESKKQNTSTQTKGFDVGLLRAHSQADGYVRALPAAEGRPPFLLVVDVGTVIEVYAEFSRSGGTYTPFPDPRSHRITLADLAKPELLGVGNDPVYVKSRCFEAFSFPAEDTGLTPALTERIRALAEQIDAHRKARQAAHADATITGMYNVLEKLRSGETLTAKDKTINDHALVGVLQSLHDELDSAVLQAYGWADLKLPADTETLLLRLVELNTQRAAEEATGTVRWLRPAFQCATGQGTQADLEAAPEPSTEDGDENNSDSATQDAASGNATIVQQPWPTAAPAQIKAVAEVLAQAGMALTLDDVAARFSARGRWRERVPGILDLLVTLGRARQQGEAAWVDVGR
jgi:hypothetical protein